MAALTSDSVPMRLSGTCSRRVGNHRLERAFVGVHAAGGNPAGATALTRTPA
jgi:hypothetical protein